MAYRRLQEHVGRFREFLRQNADTPEEQEWFILTARPSLSAPFGVQFQEV